jgi:hypothetical protein
MSGILAAMWQDGYSCTTAPPLMHGSIAINHAQSEINYAYSELPLDQNLLFCLDVNAGPCRCD